MSETYDFSTTSPASPNQSTQGQLASTYTNWLSGQVQSAADYIGFLVYTQALEGGATNADAVAAGEAAVAAMESGNFALTDLFGAAQSKSGEVDGENITDPEPMLVVNGYSVPLTDMLGGLTTESWDTTTKVGKTTQTITHTREFYSSADVPDYNENWAVVNTPPTATPIEVVFDETQSLFDSNHERTNTNPDIKTVDLLDTASDPDGDTLTVSDVVFDGGQPSYIVFNPATNELEIDLNSRELDDLKLADDPLTFTVTYTISDGKGGSVSNTAEITINGTTDLYQGSGEGTTSVTHLRSDATTGGGNINGNVLTIVPTGGEGDEEGAFDYSLTGGGTISVTSAGLTGNQSAGVSDSGSDDWNPDAINVTSGAPSNGPVELVDTALDDGKIDYNVRFNNTDSTDSVTINVAYEYEYWYAA